MHPNPAFRQESRAANLAFAAARGFGTLCINGTDGPLLAHVPFLLAEDGSYADIHLARSNLIARAALPAPAVLAVMGQDAYVSPDWYGLADQVPTWNYVAVHLRGTLSPLPVESLEPMVNDLSNRFETRLLPKPVWTSDKMSDGAMARMLRMIVPFRLTIAAVDGTWKLGQNKPAAARAGVADALEGQGAAELARLMRGLADCNRALTPTAPARQIRPVQEPTMELFTSATTPFGRKIAVQILESGLGDRVTQTDVVGSPLDPGTLPLSANPLGKIPCLIDDDGAAIFDSRVISRYLDQVSGKGLYPKGAALWPVLTLEALADGILDAALLMVYETRLRPEELRFAPWIDAQWSKISRALDTVETRSLPLLQAPLTMAHIGLAVALGYLDFRLDARNWRLGRPALNAWAKEMALRPSMVATLPKA